MIEPRDRKDPLGEALRMWGVIVVVVMGLCLLTKCTPAERAALRCKVEAVEALPPDPEAITLGDVRTVRERVLACSRGADAGGE